MRFDIFSKRSKNLPDVFQYEELPQKLRNQLIHIFNGSLYVLEQQYGAEGHVEFIHKALCHEHGIFQLSSVKTRDRYEDMEHCLSQSDDVLLILDLIELMLRAMSSQVAMNMNEYQNLWPKDLADVVNHRFRENGVGYYFDQNSQTLIRLDNTLLHEAAIKPVLSLLTDRAFSTANREFVDAFEDYKKGEFSECVVKSCAAYESVMKVICKQKGWPCDPSKATCGDLVTTIISNAKMDGFLAEPLKMIGMIRNKKSIAHGGGLSPKDVSESLARYCLNATASSILYLVESTK